MSSISQTFEHRLKELINQHSLENDSDTPDFILANYIRNCLEAYEKAVKSRDKWFQVDMWTDNKRSKDFHEYQ